MHRQREHHIHMWGEQQWVDLSGRVSMLDLARQLGVGGRTGMLATGLIELVQERLRVLGRIIIKVNKSFG